MKPNVLWICSDQQRWDTLACTGNAFVRTPHLDRLARDGVCFQQAFCQNPVCTPSRGSFLTGRYPRTTRLRANGQAIAGEETLITRRFAEAGYRCGLHGKLHLAPCHPDGCTGSERRIDDGYHVFDWSHSPDGGRNDRAGNAYSRWLKDHGRRFATQPLPECALVQRGMEDRWHQTTWCFERAESFISRCEERGEPWFCSVNCYAPHHPFDPPSEQLERYLASLDDIPLPVGLDDDPATTWQRIDRRGAYGGKATEFNDRLAARDHRLIRAAYWAMCDHIDVQVGRVLASLAAHGALDRTIIIYTSDHGELLGDHGIYLKGPHFFDPAVRVPLIISGPGVLARRVDTLVELIDLPQTLCEMAGIPAHPGMQGRSLVPVLSGRSDSHRDDVYCEFHSSDFRYDPPANASMVRTRDHKLVSYHGSGEGELYDLGVDPQERRNLWRDPAALKLRAAMLERLLDRTAQTVDPLPLATAPW